MKPGLFCLPLAFLCAVPALAADRRVYKIDSLTASRKNGVITVQAKGAVQTGGWTSPRLKVVHNDAHSVVAEFSANPPPPGMTVIEALVPVEAQARIRSRAASVHVEADANEMTTEVLH
jgi:hypothetical protein